MSKLDYSRLIHSKEQPVKSYTRKESFYLQKGNGRAGSYRGDYDGDFSVFKATRRKFTEDLAEKASKSSQDDNKIFSNEEKESECDRIGNSDVNIEVK